MLPFSVLTSYLTNRGPAELKPNNTEITTSEGKKKPKLVFAPILSRFLYSLFIPHSFFFFSGNTIP